MSKLTLYKITDTLAIELYELASALHDLLEDTQHKKHKCSSKLCPVKRAERALNNYYKFIGDK